jgi:hypothetical protein
MQVRNKLVSGGELLIRVVKDFPLWKESINNYDLAYNL